MCWLRVAAALPLWIFCFVLLLSYKSLPTQRSLMNINQGACYWSLLQICTGKCFTTGSLSGEIALHQFPLNWLDFTCEMLPNHNNCDHTVVYNQIKSWKNRGGEINMRPSLILTQKSYWLKNCFSVSRMLIQRFQTFSLTVWRAFSVWTCLQMSLFEVNMKEWQSTI